MTVLGIETATMVCGAAVARDEQVIAESVVEEPHVHAEKIMDLIAGVCDIAGGLARIEGVAVSIGPGSFTGLRIGASVAKGLAYARSLPVVGVPTLEALREHARRTAAPTGPILAVLFARRGEFFTQCDEEQDVRILRADDVAREYEGRCALVTGDVGLLQQGAGRLPGRPATDQALRCSPGMVALLGARRLSRGESDGASALAPQYTLDAFLAKAPASTPKP